MFSCVVFQVKVVSPKHRLIKVDSQEFGRCKVPLSPVTAQEEPVRTLCSLISSNPSSILFSLAHSGLLSPYLGGSLCAGSIGRWHRLLWPVWCASRPQRQRKLGAQTCTSRLLQLHGAIRGPAHHFRLVLRLELYTSVPSGQKSTFFCNRFPSVFSPQYQEIHNR